AVEPTERCKQSREHRLRSVAADQQRDRRGALAVLRPHSKPLDHTGRDDVSWAEHEEWHGDQPLREERRHARYFASIAGTTCPRTACASEPVGNRPWPTMKSLNAMRSNLSPSASSVATRRSASWL